MLIFAELWYMIYPFLCSRKQFNFFMLKRILTLLVLAVLTGQCINAQVTTSSITGTAKSAKGEPLAGATVIATHTPSGTVYSTIATKDGVFNLPNLRVGGPYSVKITYSGLSPFTVEGFDLELGRPYNINAVLSENAQTLENVVISGTRRAAVQKTGASTNISNRQITTLPTISRSITDFTRLTPQANGTSFAGRDARLNNVTIDGANLNNNFGLSSDPLPGGGSNPISLDAIEEITVNIAPYDVRQGNFTGANIAAVTKSGTNIFHGSAYTYYRNQNYIGRNVADVKLPALQSSYNKIYGGTIGGPIIKNKLFFFLNGEYEERSAVLNYYTPAGGSGQGNVSAVPIDSLKMLSDYLKSKYNYDPGPYDNFNTNVPVKNHKYLAKIDWNISDVHKLAVKYSDFQNSQTFLPSQSGGINGASSAGIITYGPKFSPTAMAFGNVVYDQVDKVRSGSFDLKSNFHGKFANQFLATITKINVDKSHHGAQFPFVDIAGLTPGSKNNYLSFGNEPFNGNYNVVVNDVYTATDNFTYFAGRHTLTAGVTYEFQKVGNGFMPGSQGYYAYGSLSDFLNNRAPKMFSLTYSLIPGQDGVISANVKVGQLGVYAQDEINVNENLRVTAGLRVDKPVYPEQPLPNKAVNELSLYDQDGNLTHYNTGQWPSAKILWSPRVGIRWNVPEQSMTLRGGTGVYTGRIPFVWLTNMPTNVGPYQFGTLVTSNLQNFLFNPDPHAYNPFYNSSLDPTKFPTTGGTVVPTGAYAIISNDFKFPQVWRTDFGVDKMFGKGWSGTLEFMYTKDINAVYMFNANQNAPNSTINLGGGITRPSYTNSAARKLNSNSGNAVVLSNTDLGHSFTFTAQLSKSFSKGFYGSVAYNYTFSQDVTANPGSQANSVWSANPTSGTQNALELSYSNFMVPHRVVANLSYRFEYINHLATTISAFYEGASQGQISYIYNGDVNNDGNSADLMYIPRNASEINFVAIPASGNVPGFTAQQQADAFFKFLAQDKYLSKHQGQVAERFGANQPWYNRVDLKVAQDIFTNFGGRKYTLQATLDVLNALNLINRDWGVKSFYIVNNPLKYVNSTNGVANYQLATYLPRGASQQVLLDRTYIKNYSTSSTYSLQLGFRLLF
jgi:outer membrane receptor protein involved in Fe transport